MSLVKSTCKIAFILIGYTTPSCISLKDRWSRFLTLIAALFWQPPLQDGLWIFFRNSFWLISSLSKSSRKFGKKNHLQYFKNRKNVYKTKVVEFFDVIKRFWQQWQKFVMAWKLFFHGELELLVVFLHLFSWAWKLGYYYDEDMVPACTQEMFKNIDIIYFMTFQKVTTWQNNRQPCQHLYHRQRRNFFSNFQVFAQIWKSK